MKRNLLLAGSLLLISGFLQSSLMGVLAGDLTARQPVANDPEFASAQSLFTQQKYAAAAQQFERVMQRAPGNDFYIYYCALAHQMNNNLARAKQLYTHLVTKFPDSMGAKRAQVRLDQLAGGGASIQSAQAVGNSANHTAMVNKTMSPTGATASDPELAAIPEHVRIPYDKVNDAIIVEMAVNDRRVQFELDTGAPTVTVGKNHLQEWGLVGPEARKKFEMGGVGDGRAKGWTQRFSLKLGPITRRDFPVTVMDNMPTKPLLGQTFLRPFNLTVDENARMVVLAKKGSSSSSNMLRRKYRDVEIPYKLSGGHMMVNTLVNGKPLVMVFDTGCEGITFSMADWQRLGFEIPASARRGRSMGVLGETTCYIFNIDSLALGPIEQSDVSIDVTEGCPKSLLGTGFFGNMKYTIDSTNKVIVFERAQF